MSADVTWQVIPIGNQRILKLRAKATYRLNNFGKSPAVKVFPTATSDVSEVLSVQWGKPIGAMATTCATMEGASRVAGTSKQYLTEGDVVFPQTPFWGSNESSFDVGPSAGKTIDHIWLLACVAYWDSITKEVHHTKVWFVSIPKDENETPVPVAAGQTITWKPPVTFRLWDSEAD